MADNRYHDQQQQPQYGVELALQSKANARPIPYLPNQRAIENKAKAPAYVPKLIGVPNIRAKPLPVPLVRAQTQQAMIEGDMLVDQALIQQHEQQQHNIALNRMYD